MDIVHVCIQYSNLKNIANTDFMYFQVFSNIQWLNTINIACFIFRSIYAIAIHKTLFSISAWIPNIKEEKRKNINVRKMFISYLN
jgi:hypothetical protein